MHLELDIHVFDVDGRAPSGRLNFTKHALVTLRFEGVESVGLDGFAPQNVLDDLVLTDHGPGHVSRSRIEVELPSNNGLGGSFYCEESMVLAVALHEPGPHSVYGRGP